MNNYFNINNSRTLLILNLGGMLFLYFLREFISLSFPSILHYIIFSLFIIIPSLLVYLTINFSVKDSRKTLTYIIPGIALLIVVTWMFILFAKQQILTTP